LDDDKDQEPNIGIRRSHVPADIDIRSISSHAQAEVLVQRAQQSILDMEGYVAADDIPLISGRSPLSAKLAAYGESLALERRLKREEEAKIGEEMQVIEDKGMMAAPVVFTRDSGSRSGSPRVRDIRVLETTKSTNPSRSRIRQPRRPNTSESTSSSKSPAPLTGDWPSRAHHQISHSASAVIESTDDITIVSATTPQSSLSAHLLSQQQPSVVLSAPRSRTPDPSSSDDLTSVGHVPLSRCSTAPAAESITDVLEANTKHDPATRHIASANKLTRMGFSAKDGYQPVVTPSATLRGQEPKSRFGIKSFFKAK